VRTPRLDLSVNGAGDAIAALFLVHYLASNSVADALSNAVSSIYGILKRTHEARSREILLIEAQSEIVEPSRRFVAQEL
jgi:pyridoxine kinase